MFLLKNAAAGQCKDKALKSLFMENLPDNVRSILSVCETEDVNKLAVIADKVFENQTPPTYVSQVKSAPVKSFLGFLANSFFFLVRLKKSKFFVPLKHLF